MAPEKYIKREGYTTLIFLISSMLIIVPLLTATFGQVTKFRDLTDISIRQKHEQIAVLTSINKSIEFLLTSGIHYFIPDAPLIDPSSSTELLVHEDSGIIAEFTLSSEIYNMNYVISDDTGISDILIFPPSQKTVAGAKHFLIRTTIHKSEAPSYCVEIAARLTPIGDVDELWRREFVIY